MPTIGWWGFVKCCRSYGPPVLRGWLRAALKSETAASDSAPGRRREHRAGHRSQSTVGSAEDARRPLFVFFNNDGSMDDKVVVPRVK